ncbi:hypothetical protein SAMN00790413_06494 [Deinococcus hopiensis KR-140]|uniref:Uncharacterized protein n=1 Tax=Deinococcus hopiensis KR-140 TaxID=695939 RepID=A0A1W1UAJ2_9DEIO|nr:hypothetical protein SAMN00790413_06494 [Deinococcus hopiensis KR-140]
MVPFPTTEEDIRACADDIRGGNAAFTQDTELGMVRWEDAQRGVTNGIRGEAHPDFTSSVNKDSWFLAHVPAPDLLELVRTPNCPS